MKIYACYSRSHKVLFDNFFLPSLPPDMELVVEKQSQICRTARYRENKWTEAVTEKIRFLLRVIQENMGRLFVFSDVDIQFFGPISEEIVTEMNGYDLGFQNESGMYCTGFFACLASDRTLAFFQDVYEKIPTYRGDQEATNHIFSRHPDVRIKHLSEKFWTHAGKELSPPSGILLHHANCTSGIDFKINLLDRVKEIVSQRDKIIQFPLVCCSSRTEENGSVKNLFGVEYLFNQLDLDVDWSVDIGEKSKISEKFDPEQRIWVHVEPEPYTRYFEGFDQYYKGGIFSWHPRVEDLPQFKKMRMGIRGVKPSFIPDKKFGVSGLISKKCADWSAKLEKSGYPMEGYRLRRKILDNQDKILIPSLVRNFQRRWKGQSHDYPVVDKSSTMDFMFHFAIENCLEKNYFTEKLTDCFLTYCIPLFFGEQKNLAEYFDLNGIIFINEDNWLDVVNSLSEDDYEKRIESMEENSSRALMFLQETTDVYKNISRIILKCY